MIDSEVQRSSPKLAKPPRISPVAFASSFHASNAQQTTQCGSRHPCKYFPPSSSSEPSPLFLYLTLGGHMELLKGGKDLGCPLEAEVQNCGKSLQSMLEAQRDILHSQIDDLQRIVVLQCRLTGVNPLSQEMAAGALSIKIGRRPRDLLSPKAIKCLQGIFAIKDTVTKREAREISALCGATITQVREFFSGQRSRVRRLARQSRDKANNVQVGNISEGSSPSVAKHSSCLTTLLHSQRGVRSKSAGKESCQLSNDNSLEDRELFDTNFIKGFFFLMRKEGTFSGQVQLLERILQIHDTTVLCWFVTKGGIPILAKWLSRASVEEQTTVLHVIFKVLCHLPLHKALPVQMSTILQTVNKLRFYRSSDISNRARILLARWSKLFVRSQCGRKAAPSSSQGHAQRGGLQQQHDISTKKRSDESSREDTDSNNKRFKTTSFEDAQECVKKKLAYAITNTNSPRHSRLLQNSLQKFDSEGSKKRPVHSICSDQTKERRKVLLVDEPSTVTARRKVNTGAVFKNSSRPLSTDDIQKAKRQSQWLQSKFDELVVLKFDDGHLEKIKPSESAIAIREDCNKGTCSKASLQKSSILEDPFQGCQNAVQATNDNITGKEKPGEEEEKNVPIQGPSLTMTQQFGEIQMLWMTPPEMVIDPSWSFASGEESKEVEFQLERVKREKEAVYSNEISIPFAPREPWDIELDYDDSLTLEIPLEPIVTQDSPKIYSLRNEEKHQEMKNDKNKDSDYFVGVRNGKTCIGNHSIGTLEVSSYMDSKSDPIQRNLKQITTNNGETGPDLELLAVLLKNPDLVFALTSERGARFNKSETVALLDLLKTTSSKQESFGGEVSSFASKKLDVISSSGFSGDHAVKYDELLVRDTTPSVSVRQSVQGMAEAISTTGVVSSFHVLQSNDQASTHSFYTGKHGETYRNGDFSDLGLKKQKLFPSQGTEKDLAQEPQERVYSTQNNWSQQDTAKPPPPFVPLKRPTLATKKYLPPEYERSCSSSQQPTWPLVGQNPFNAGNIKKHGFGVSTVPSIITEHDSLKSIKKVSSSAVPAAQPALKNSPFNVTNGPLPVMIAAGQSAKQSTSQGFSPSFARQSPVHQGHMRAPNAPVIPAMQACETMQTSSSNNAGIFQGVFSERGDHIDRIRSLVMDFGKDIGRDHPINSFSAHSQAHSPRTDVFSPPLNYSNNILPLVQPNLLSSEPVEWVHPRRASNYTQRPIPRAKFFAPKNREDADLRGNHPPSTFHQVHNPSLRTIEPGHSNQPGSLQPQSPWTWTGSGPPRAGWR